MKFETILYAVEDRVATITLHRPERYNAITAEMGEELRTAWTEVKRDPEVVCVILTGSGEKALCTGMDRNDIASGRARKGGKMGREDVPWFTLTAIQNKCWKPVITAGNGMVCGGGLHFVADSDLILCADYATFFDTHVKVGLIAGIEPVGLVRRIPLEAVLRMSLLGGAERMSAQEAHRLGLVGEVLPAADLIPRARELAAKIAQHYSHCAGAQRAGHRGESRDGSRRGYRERLADDPPTYGLRGSSRRCYGVRRATRAEVGSLYG